MSGLGLLGGTALIKQPQSQQPKDQLLCPELIATVDNFRAFLSEQKKLREELVNLSQQPLVKLKDELSCIVQQVSAVTAGLRRITAQRDRLSEDVKKEEANMGIVQRNADSGLVMQYENNATIEYFLSKAVEFDTRMCSYKQELEVIEENISSQNRSCLSPKDLVSLLRQMDNEFICLAAQLYTAYEQIKVLKTHYLRNLRSNNSDSRNPFSEVEAASAKLRQLDANLDLAPLSLRQTSNVKTPYGPTRFLSTTNTATPLLPALTNQTTNFNVGTQPNPLGLQAPNLLGQRSSDSLNPSIGLGLGGSPFAQSGATTRTNLSLSGPFQLNPLGATTTANIPTGLGSTTSAAQKPFSFGLGMPTATATTGTGVSPFGQTTATAATSPFTTSVFPGTSGIVASAPSSLFGAGLGSTSSAGDNLFGKRVATKPSSLFLPKT
ncbi:Methionine aminopeptidase 1D mitochondrial [Fasciola hepatica]|uniref:Methionine aminopeptidase 1D mitochondrial n=1 Tax=Fasciola hepatica TaxID=6192 RepID=A0A2H1CJX0_FASHE|nr:Methionine aminopeptidase 1D mitochondrial [Fasciola hepatica]